MITISIKDLLHIYDLVWTYLVFLWVLSALGLLLCLYQGFAVHLWLSLDLLSILVGFVSLRITVPVTFWPALNTASSVSKRMSNASIFILNNSNQSHSHSSLPRAIPHLKQSKWRCWLGQNVHPTLQNTQDHCFTPLTTWNNQNEGAG